MSNRNYFFLSEARFLPEPAWFQLIEFAPSGLNSAHAMFSLSIPHTRWSKYWSFRMLLNLNPWFQWFLSHVRHLAWSIFVFVGRPYELLLQPSWRRLSFAIEGFLHGHLRFLMILCISSCFQRFLKLMMYEIWLDSCTASSVDLINIMKFPCTVAALHGFCNCFWPSRQSPLHTLKEPQQKCDSQRTHSIIC